MPSDRPTSAPHFARNRKVPDIARGYDRVAWLYRWLEPLFLIHPGARRRAVAAMDLSAEDSVLELGCGSGRNFPYLIQVIGPTGQINGVDASSGMLDEARRLIRQRGWTNVELLQADAARLDLESRFDAVLFSLSYSAMPERMPAAEAAWRCLRPGGRLVVMDAGLQNDRLGRFLRPLASLLLRFVPGDPDSRPWDDLAALGPVTTERFLFGIYYTCTVTKPGPGSPGR